MKKALKLSVLFLFVLLLTIFSFSSNDTIAVSTDQYVGQVQLGGDTIGIQIKTKVEIVGKYEIVKENAKIRPWENSDIEEGDYIYSVNDVLINSNKDLIPEYTLIQSQTSKLFYRVLERRNYIFRLNFISLSR